MDPIIFSLALLLSAALGGIIGWQRESIGRAAGIRTYAVVSVGATIFTLISSVGFPTEPSRVAAEILVGIGFIGAGTILHHGQKVEGLTTAAGLWSVTAIGMAVGVGWYVSALIATFLIWLILFLDDKKFFRTK